MNRKLITAACMALVLAACGDKSDTATGSAEPGMMDKAMDATSEMASDAADAAGEAADAAGEMASEAAGAVSETAGDIAEGASEMASDAVDATKEVIHDTAQGIADSTAPEVTEEEKAQAMEMMDDMEKSAESMGQ